jgi:translation initiation factor IF-3
MQQQQNNNSQFRFRKNYQIKAAQVRLINSDGSNVGVVSLQEALRQAKEQLLDLIEINSKSVPIVVKIADYGKMLYEEKKKAQQIRKNQAVCEQKELVCRPNTASEDYDRLIEKTKVFLENGNRVKVTIRFRGREITHIDLGKEKISFLVKELEGLIMPNPQISLEGKFMSVVLSPAKKN